MVWRRWSLGAVVLVVACSAEPPTSESDEAVFAASNDGPAGSLPTTTGDSGVASGAEPFAPATDAGSVPGAEPGPPVLSRPTSEPLTELPDIVYLKTNTQSFNRLYYFAVLEGELWYKANVEVTGLDGAWQKLPVLPEMQGRLAMVSADDHGLVVFNEERRLYWTMSEALGTPLIPRWQSAWGAPLASGPGLTLPEPILKWEYACLTRQEDDHFIDPAGNKQLVGLGSVAHVWILTADGQHITYIDPILPVDTSYEMCGPHRGRFKSANLSMSGSTSFAINAYGDMYTRLYDFDISGADTLFFAYSYEATPGAVGAPIKLPAPDWIQHPKVPGSITDRITIFKTGKGSNSRTLRVEGMDESGETGFYEKAITGMASSDWVFHATGDPLRGNQLQNDPGDRSRDTLGPGDDRMYSGSEPGWTTTLVDFNLHCSPATLQVVFDSGAQLELVLHHADAIRQQPRETGLTAQPRELNGAIEVPEAVWVTRNSLGADEKAFLSKLSAVSRFTTVPLSVTDGAVSLNGWSLDYAGP